MNIFCMVKWGSGYPAKAFNRTFRALRDHADGDARVVCITDDPTGLTEGIEVVALPDIPLDPSQWTPGMWPKLAMFKAGTFPDGARIVYVDVDIAVVGDVLVFFENIAPDTVQIIQDWKPYHEQWLPGLFPNVRGGNSSTLAFMAGEHDYIWDEFSTDPIAAYNEFCNDQNYITAKARTRAFFPQAWVASFKKTVAPLPPLAWFSSCAPGSGCRIVAFHGKPEIEDLCGRSNSTVKRLREGYGRVDWIDTYLARYG